MRGGILADWGDGINFWPAFSDFMLAIVLVFFLVLVASLSNRIDTRQAEAAQHRLAESSLFAQKGFVERRTPDKSQIEWLQGSDIAIRFETEKNDPFLQHITFAETVLFDTDRADLNDQGKEVLRLIGQGINEAADEIQEIQIHGHADVRPVRGHFQDNLELASARANTVFRFLQFEVGTDPVAHLMSATSFGEFAPVGRKSDEQYTEGDLQRDNSDENKMRQNRRIEILLFYKRSVREPK
jgi:outer membrane protein OmpA-like peptidoglycan-associated protein